MSMDRCYACWAFVDTDMDVDCYDNPKLECICEKCRESTMEDDIINQAAEKAEQAQIVSVSDILMDAFKPMSTGLLRQVYTNPQTYKDLGKEI